MQGIKSSPSYVDPEQLVQVIAHQFDGEGPLQLGHPAGRDSSNDFFQNCHALRSEEARLMPEKSPDAKRLRAGPTAEDLLHEHLPVSRKYRRELSRNTFRTAVPTTGADAGHPTTHGRATMHDRNWGPRCL